MHHINREETPRRFPIKLPHIKPGVLCDEPMTVLNAVCILLILNSIGTAVGSFVFIFVCLFLAFRDSKEVALQWLASSRRAINTKVVFHWAEPCVVGSTVSFTVLVIAFLVIDLLKILKIMFSLSVFSSVEW